MTGTCNWLLPSGRYFKIRIPHIAQLGKACRREPKAVSQNRFALSLSGKGIVNAIIVIKMERTDDNHRSAG
jgi:hypothetical protein